MPGSPSAPLCAVSADPQLRRNLADLLAGQGYAVVQADGLEQLIRHAASGVAAAIVDSRLPGSGPNPLAMLRATPALHSVAILVLRDDELASLRGARPSPALVHLILRVHTQMNGDAQLDLLQDVSSQLTSTPDIASTMEAVLAAVADRVRLDTATLFMVEPDGHIRARAAYGYDLELATFREVLPGEGVVGWVVERRVSTIVGDSDLDGRFQAADGRSSRSMCAVPILMGARVLGALTLVRRAPAEQFTDSDLVLVATIGSSAGVALENARLYEHERALRARLEELDRIVGEERELLAKLETYDRMYTQVVATVSHELKTPLMGIRGFAQMIRDDTVDPDEIRDFAGEIVGNAERLGYYVEDILAEDAVHAGRVQVDLGPVRLRPLVAQVIRSLTPSVTPLHRLVSEVPPDAPPVLGDPDKLVQIVTNLVSNALKYSPDGGVVRVRAETGTEGDMVTLAVEDEGMGVPEELRERIFDRFYRVPSSARIISGTGLGLSIVRGLVDLHGGRIAVEAGSNGRGSRFLVSLPSAIEVASDSDSLPPLRVLHSPEDQEDSTVIHDSTPGKSAEADPVAEVS